MYYICSDMACDVNAQDKIETQYFAGFNVARVIRDDWQEGRTAAARYTDWQEAEKDVSLLVSLGHPRRYLHIGELA